MEHYFTAKPSSKTSPRELKAVLRGESFRFRTDAGVFSRGRIDPGTRLLAESFAVEPDATVLDLGCGYGPLGIVAARLTPRGRVYMVEINERAAALARENLRLNGITNAEVRVGDGFAPVADLSFDLILMNPPLRAGKRVVYPLVEEAFRHLRRGGSLYLVVRTRQGAGSLKEHLRSVFGNGEDVERGGGYRVLRAVRE